MTIIRADSTIATLIKELASEKHFDRADKLDGGSIPSLLKVNVQEVMPEIALNMLNFLLQLFKGASPTDSFDKMDTKEVELGIVQLNNPLETPNNRNCSLICAIFTQRPKSWTSACARIGSGELYVRKLGLFTTACLRTAEMRRKHQATN